jgi:hypothetical protein
MKSLKELSKKKLGSKFGFIPGIMVLVVIIAEGLVLYYSNNPVQCCSSKSTDVYYAKLLAMNSDTEDDVNTLSGTILLDSGDEYSFRCNNKSSDEAEVNMYNELSKLEDNDYIGCVFTTYTNTYKNLFGDTLYTESKEYITNVSDVYEYPQWSLTKFYIMAENKYINED